MQAGDPAPHVYDPWTALRAFRWVQVVVLADPLVYASEALRTALSPKLPHVPTAATLPALAAATVPLGYVATRSYTRRVLA